MTGEIWGGIVAFLTLSGGLFAVWRALSRQIEDDMGRLEGRVERVEVRLAERMTRVESRLTATLREFMRDVKSMMAQVGSPVDGSQGPIRPTELGKTVSRPSRKRTDVGERGHPVGARGV